MFLKDGVIFGTLNKMNRNILGTLYLLFLRQIKIQHHISAEDKRYGFLHFDVKDGILWKVTY